MVEEELSSSVSGRSLEMSSAVMGAFNGGVLGALPRAGKERSLKVTLRR